MSQSIRVAAMRVSLDVFILATVASRLKCAADAAATQGSSGETDRVADIGWTHTEPYSRPCGTAAKRKYSAQAGPCKILAEPARNRDRGRNVMAHTERKAASSENSMQIDQRRFLGT